MTSRIGRTRQNDRAADRDPRLASRGRGLPRVRVLAAAVASALVGALAMLPATATARPSGPADGASDLGAGDPRPDQRSEAAGQPYAPHWFPAEILDWSPDNDPNAPFNRSNAPLAERVQDEQTGAHADAAARRVMALSVFGNTSGNPSQGSDDFDAYLSEFWQYLDTLVFWGGSADEGLIVAPNPTVTDAAHRNGVPVLGTVFLPPEAFGGDLQSTRDLLRRDPDGTFPVAEKLIEAAHYYGFDGWFVNAETEGADAEVAGEMRDFLRALRAEASEGTATSQGAEKSEHAADLRVLWYDSMVESGQITWQNALNEQNDDFFAVSDLMFLNYGWDHELLRGSAEHAEQLGRDPDALHAGIDVGSRQFDIQDSMDTLYPSDGNDHGISLGLYRPDFTLTGADDPSAYAERESRFWVGADGDPASSEPDSTGFRGISSVVAEHTPVTETPFTTSFSTGRGTGWFHDGQRWQTGDWNNLSAQDVLPTWRFMLRGPGAEGVSVGYDDERAWRGGSSLRFDGRLTDEVRVPLYATRLAVQPTTEVSVTSQPGSAGSADAAEPGDGAEQALLLWFDGASGPEVAPLGRAQDGQWATETVSLSAYAGKTLTRVGVRLASPDGTVIDLDHRLGGLSITEGETPTPGQPADVRIESGDEGDARVFWSAPDDSDESSATSHSGMARANTADTNVGGTSVGGTNAAGVVDRYQVEAVGPDGDRTWLGTTSGHAFYVPSVPTAAERIEVVPLDGAGSRGEPGSTRFGGDS